MPISTNLPSTMQAWVQVEVGEAPALKQVPLPVLNDNEVLIKVEYVALNPTDHMHLAHQPLPGAIMGSDFSGTIVALGPNLATSRKVGDRVAGTNPGGQTLDRGTFAEYTKAESDLVFNVPEGFSMEGGSHFGVTWITALQAIMHMQNHPWPDAFNTQYKDKWYLVYGGSTSVGLFTIQVAKMYGYKVISTSSPHNANLVRSYGADHVVDYHDAEKCISEIKETTGGGVSIGLDAVSTSDSFKISLGAFKQGGGVLSCVIWPSEEDKALRSDVEIKMVVMYTTFGRDFTFGPIHIPASAEDRAFAVEAWKRSTGLIEEFKVRPNPVDLQGGREAIGDGLEFMKGDWIKGDFQDCLVAKPEIDVIRDI